MRILLLSILFALTCCAGRGQTTYYANLLNELQTGFGLSGGVWSLAADEQQVLNSAAAYGVTQSVAGIAGQPFSKAATLQVPAAGADPWSAGFFVSNTQALAAGDRLLFVVWIRSATTADGRANLFIENADTYSKEIYLSVDVPQTWTRFLVPFEADQAYAAGKLHLGWHTGQQVQTLQVGGIALRNYAKSYSLGQLPIQLNQDYAGSAPDAPWRTKAAARIEQIRKANLHIQVLQPDGSPNPGAVVHVEMLRHAFKFGSAVTASRLAGNHNQDNTYQQKILDFDGKGHGFNEVVFENDLKWDAWEQQWTATHAEVVNAAAWLRQHGIAIRGHNMVWPGWNYLPSDLAANQLNRAYLKTRIDNRINEMLTYPGLAGQLEEWDALNEITANQDLANAFQGAPGYVTGREIYQDILRKIKTTDPAMPVYLNDYVTIDQGNAPGNATYERCKQYIREIKDAGVPVEGLGFQGHIGAGLVSLYTVQQTLDDFSASFGCRAKITEYDYSELLNDSLAARFTADFLTMAFSHPSVDGFLSWGFWDGAHWNGHAPYFTQNWTLKPAGQAVADLLFHQWWTDETRPVATDGTVALRGFKGQYRITVSCDGFPARIDTIQLSGDVALSYTCGLTGVKAVDSPDWAVAVQNPVQAGALLSVRCSTIPRLVRLCSAEGRVLAEQQPAAAEISFPAPSKTGLYFLQITGPDGRVHTRKLAVQ